MFDSKLVSKEAKEHCMVWRTKELEKLQTNLQVTITIQANRKNKNLSKEILGPITPHGDISHGDFVRFDNSLTHLHTHELEAFTHFDVFKYVQFQLNKDFFPICIVALLNWQLHFQFQWLFYSSSQQTTHVCQTLDPTSNKGCKLQLDSSSMIKLCKITPYENVVDCGHFPLFVWILNDCKTCL